MKAINTHRESDTCDFTTKGEGLHHRSHLVEHGCEHYHVERFYWTSTATATTTAITPTQFVSEVTSSKAGTGIAPAIEVL